MPARRRVGRGGNRKAAEGAERKSKPRKKPQEDADEALEYVEPTTVPVIPADRVELEPQALEAEVTRVLTWNDPNVPRNITKYSYKDLTYKLDPPGNNDHLGLHFQTEGHMLHTDTDEAKMQEAAEQKKLEREKERERRKKEAETSDAVDALVDDTTKNRFNYSERAAQTFNNPLREKGVATQPPPMSVFSSTVSQWDVYDQFMQRYLDAQRDAEMTGQGSKKKGKGKKGKGKKKGPAVEAAPKPAEEDVLHSAAVGKSLKILERMVNQNKEDELYRDFKYWEDMSDEFRPADGSLLPLWRFSSERSKRKQVTSICWHPAFPDLFAVGFGSYDFMAQGSGLIYCYSLKNTSHPEYTFSTESGVMCVDFHPQHHALLCVGCYDGTVMVFDVRKKQNKPIYQSTIRTGKHTDPVWRVVWQQEDMAKELTFFSISSDGHVANWLMTNTELKMEPVMALKLVSSSKDEAEEESSLTGLAGGCCLDFNRFSEHLFVVGTEEGRVHKCSKAYSGQYLETYTGHHMATYAVAWNPFHPRVFISCSADWTVKIWDHARDKPMMTFDLGEAVGDVAWSPFSSTVFAAVTSDGRVHVFDLTVNKHEPMCEQKVVKRARLTHIAFNPVEPVVLVGDDRGGVVSLKLSPNLRKQTEVEEGKTKQEVEMEKMETLLASIDTRFD